MFLKSITTRVTLRVEPQIVCIHLYLLKPKLAVHKMSVIVSVSVHLCKVHLCYFVHAHKSEDSLQKDCDACHLHSFLLSLNKGLIHMYCMFMQCIEIVLQLIVFSPLITSHFKIHEWTRGISAPCSSCWSLSLFFE